MPAGLNLRNFETGQPPFLYLLISTGDYAMTIGTNCQQQTKLVCLGNYIRETNSIVKYIRLAFDAGLSLKLYNILLLYAPSASRFSDFGLSGITWFLEIDGKIGDSDPINTPVFRL